MTYVETKSAEAQRTCGLNLAKFCPDQLSGQALSYAIPVGFQILGLLSAAWPRYVLCVRASERALLSLPRIQTSRVYKVSIFNGWRYRKPVQLIWGELDPYFDSWFLEKWLTYFPQAIVSRIPSAGYWVLEDADQEVVLAIQSFLS